MKQHWVAMTPQEKSKVVEKQMRYQKRKEERKKIRAMSSSDARKELEKLRKEAVREFART